MLDVTLAIVGRERPRLTMAFERIGSETVWEGQIATVRVDRFRYDDGEEADREVVAHPGAVAIVAHDGERLYLVRQPREAVGRAGAARAAGRQARRATARSRSTPPSASSPRRSARAPGAGAT